MEPVLWACNRSQANGCKPTTPDGTSVVGLQPFACESVGQCALCRGETRRGLLRSRTSPAMPVFLICFCVQATGRHMPWHPQGREATVLQPDIVTAAFTAVSPFVISSVHLLAQSWVSKMP